jgi:hypothetical protein
MRFVMPKTKLSKRAVVFLSREQFTADEDTELLVC